MNGKNMRFENRKIKKVISTKTRNKKLFKKDDGDVDELLVPKKNHVTQIFHWI